MKVFNYSINLLNNYKDKGYRLSIKKIYKGYVFYIFNKILVVCKNELEPWDNLNNKCFERIKQL